MTNANEDKQTCCGHECPTAFCPHCGKNMPGSVLAGLLAHCRLIQTRAEKDVTAYGDDGSAMVRSKKRTAAKWKAWGDELVKLISPDARR